MHSQMHSANAFKYTILSFISATLPLTRHDCSQCISVQCTFALIFRMILSNSFISPSINWKSGQCHDTFSTHFPLSSQLLACLPLRLEHYTKNKIMWRALVLEKRFQSKIYLKVGISLGIFVVCNLSISIPLHIQPCPGLIHD
jgi:hypothetical protein